MPIFQKDGVHRSSTDCHDDHPVLPQTHTFARQYPQVIGRFWGDAVCCDTCTDEVVPDRVRPQRRRAWHPRFPGCHRPRDVKNIKRRLRTSTRSLSAFRLSALSQPFLKAVLQHVSPGRIFRRDRHVDRQALPGNAKADAVVCASSSMMTSLALFLSVAAPRPNSHRNFTPAFRRRSRRGNRLASSDF